MQPFLIEHIWVLNSQINLALDQPRLIGEPKLKSSSRRQNPLEFATISFFRLLNVFVLQTFARCFYLLEVSVAEKMIAKFKATPRLLLYQQVEKIMHFLNGAWVYIFDYLRDLVVTHLRP